MDRDHLMYWRRTSDLCREVSRILHSATPFSAALVTMPGRNEWPANSRASRSAAAQLALTMRAMLPR
jgi:hypothetical protein